MQIGFVEIGGGTVLAKLESSFLDYCANCTKRATLELSDSLDFECF